MKAQTLRQTDERDEEDSKVAQIPGLVAIFSSGKPVWLPLALSTRSQAAPDSSSMREITLGRDNVGVALGDGKISRHHVLVRYEQERFVATDLGSLNGTGIDGRPAASGIHSVFQRCLRIGDTLLVPTVDLFSFTASSPTHQEGFVVGPRLHIVHQRIARIAKSSHTLHVTGESGAGKEHAAQVFHKAGPVRNGPFVAVNCATIQESIAERLLFGAKRGAFSGAVSDSEGYIQAAHNGTLFLDEVAELHLSVQAKLLRVLESKEVVPVGAVKPQSVNLRIVSASHRSLAEEVARGRLRHDLYYRVGLPAERVPSLRDRVEEIPWLIESALQRSGDGLTAHVSLVEACLLRPWPGNVRELLLEIRAAVQEAVARDSVRVKAEHLTSTAGQSIETVPQERETETMSSDGHAVESKPSPSRPTGPAVNERPSRAMIIATLIDTGCNLSEAARRMGMHRTTLRREIARLDIRVGQLRTLLK